MKRRDPAVLAQEAAKRAGDFVVQISEGKGRLTLNLYRHEVWKTPPLGEQAVASSLASGRAEVVVQNQIAQRTTSVRLRTINTTSLHVGAPSRECTLTFARQDWASGGRKVKFCQVTSLGVV